MRVSSDAADPAGAQGEADGVGAVLLLARRRRGRAGRASAGAGAGPSGSSCVQVLVLQHLAELLRAPVGHEELHPRVVALPAVAVVAEDRGGRRPDVGDLVGADEDADPLGELRVGRQAAADPQVVAGLAVGVRGRRRRRRRRSRARCSGRTQPGHRGLPLARQVAELGAADVLRDRLGQHVAGVERPRRRGCRPAGSRACRAGCRRRPPSSTGRPPRAAARSPGRPRCGSSAAARSAGR